MLVGITPEFRSLSSVALGGASDWEAMFTS